MVADLSPQDRDVRRIFGAFRRAFSFQKPLTLEEFVRAGNVLIPDEKGKGGPFDLDQRPYHRGICRAYHIWNSIDLVWGAQVGKSAFISAVMCYVANQDPATMMIGFPDRATAARRSRNELRPVLEKSPGTMDQVLKTKDSMSTFEYRLKRMAIMFAWAGSPSSLAAETVKHMIAEEAAKWKRRDKLEGDPLSLFWRRGIDWGDLARRLLVTTPNFEHTHGWIEWAIGTQHRFYIPCPHCGDPSKLDHVRDPEDRWSASELADDIEAAGYQFLEWQAGEDGKAGITGWGDERDPGKVEGLACYRCKYCGEAFGDGDKNRMQDFGKWIGEYPKREWFSSQLPSWYSPSVTFGQVARRFYEAQGSVVMLQDFTNSDKAEAFVEKWGEKEPEAIRRNCCDYKSGTMPFRPLVIVVTVDVQMAELYYEIGAHGKARTYAKIQSGRLPRVRKLMPDETFSTGLEIADTLMHREFYCHADEGIYLPTYGFMDSGDGEDTADIYKFVEMNQGWIALKGQENQKTMFKFSYPQKYLGTDGREHSRTDGAMLVSISSGMMKDGWAKRWETEPGEPGSWMLPDVIDDQYAFQLTQEYKKDVPVGNYGRTESKWVRRSAQNHYFDCSYYQHSASVFMDVDQMEFPEEMEVGEARPVESVDFKPGTSWVTGD